MPFIEHSLGRTFYQSRGSKRTAGLPLVCLHGGPGGHSYFMQDLFKLADERRVFIYDQIGGGRSSQTPRSRWTVHTFVQELKWNLFYTAMIVPGIATLIMNLTRSNDSVKVSPYPYPEP